MRTTTPRCSGKSLVPHIEDRSVQRPRRWRWLSLSALAILAGGAASCGLSRSGDSATDSASSDSTAQRRQGLTVTIDISAAPCSAATLVSAINQANSGTATAYNIALRCECTYSFTSADNH